MATQGYQTEAQRIGKYKGQILGHAMPQEVAGRFGVKKEIPKNSGDTVIFRRWLPTGATAGSPNTWSVDPAKHTIQEGVTPVADTIKRADSDQRVAATEPRDGLWQAQTPQMFRYGQLKKALEMTSNVTDEAGAIEAAGMKPRLVKADSTNLKVTYPADLALAAMILRARK